MGLFLVEVRILGSWELPEVGIGLLDLTLEGRTFAGSGALRFLNWLWKV